MKQELADLMDVALRDDDGDPASLVYFFLRSDGLIKIGWSANVAQREHTLKTAAGPLVLLATMRGGRAEEKRLHQLFDSCRVWPRQEWFHPSEELLDFVNQVADTQMANLL